MEALHEDIERSLARQVGDAGKLNRAGQPQCANADHVGQALERAVHRIAQHFAHFASALEQIFFFIEVERGDCRRTGDRMAGVGVAVHELDRVRWAFFMDRHHRVVQMASANHATERDHAIGHALGEVQHIGHDAKIVCGKVGAQAAKTGDDLVKNQQNAVLVANLAQTLQIAFGRQVPASTARHRLHHDRCNVAGVMQGQDAVL